MKCLLLSNYSDKIAGLNEITAPNKQTYADLHGYDFLNIKLDYNKCQMWWLCLVLDKLKRHDVIMTMGCDTLICNQSIKVEDKFPHVFTCGYLPDPAYPPPAPNCAPISILARDLRVILARDQLTNWPINNDVMLWPAGDFARELLDQLIKDFDKWKNYTQLWQIHLFNLISSGKFKNHVRIVDAKEMNATYQPVVSALDDGGNVIQLRHPGPSSFQFGDWILHAFDMTLENKIKVMRWGEQFVTKDGMWRPIMPGR